MVKVYGSNATSRFKRSVKRAKKRGLDMTKLEKVIKQAELGTLNSSYDDHALKGEWTGHRECHIQGDWLLVYRYTKHSLLLVDTGTHADIFGM